ncbi:MAG: N-acetyltransferase [Flavobacteriaceae bacterium]|jgi:predicted GNAT family acetyltransferase|nr:N-acetyltransferase [Flavobacteriaceae bacterium]
MEIKHSILGNKGEFVALQDGKRAGEMTYSVAGSELIIVDHTGVEDEFKGLGVGKRILLDGVVKYAREHKIKVMPLCPFAKAMFEKMPEIHDVLAK